MLTTTNYRLNKVNADEIHALWQQIKAVYERHFGVEFAADYLNQKCVGAHFARLRVMWHEQKAVGIFLLFGYRLEVQQKQTLVYRASAAVDRGFRSKNNLNKFMFSNIMGQVIKYRFRRKYLIEGFIHPSSYTLTQKNLHRAYPSVDYPTPPSIQHLIKTIAQTDILEGYSFVHQHPFLVDAAHSTTQTSEEMSTWQQKIKTDRHVAFYHRLGAMEPHRALAAIIPVSIKNLTLSLLKSRKTQARNRAEKQRAKRAVLN